MSNCLFCRIIAGEIPASKVHEDERVVAFLSIEPMMPGHTLVVPRDEVDHWIDLDPDLAAHLFQVSQTIGKAQMAAFTARRIGVMIVGDEVPHVHLHVVPFDSVSELSFAHADPNPPEGSLDAAAAKIRTALRDQLDAAGAEHVSE